MADLPTPRERRTAKVVIYVTPGDHRDLTSLAQTLRMSVSELGALTLDEALNYYRQNGVNVEALPSKDPS